MKKLKPQNSFRAGDVVHIRTRVEHHHKKQKQVMTFGRIERMLGDDLCLVSYIEKLNDRWCITINDVPTKVSELKPYPNQHLIKIIKEDLRSETNADIVGRWLGG